MFGPLEGIRWNRHWDPPFILFSPTDLGTVYVERREGGSGWWFVRNGLLGDQGYATEEEAIAEGEAWWQQKGLEEVERRYNAT